VASGSNDSTVRVWDIATGQADQTLTGPSGSVWLVVFSPDGWAGSMAFSPYGKVALSSYSLSKSRHWVNWNGSRILYLLPLDVRPGVTAFSGDAFAIGSPNGRVTVISFIPENCY